jgi:hypothetical protein
MPLLTTTFFIATRPFTVGDAAPSGGHIRKVTPVPIPNTVVKLSEPMVVPTSARVGAAGFFLFNSKSPRDPLRSRGFFYVRIPSG